MFVDGSSERQLCKELQGQLKRFLPCWWTQALQPSPGGLCTQHDSGAEDPKGLGQRGRRALSKNDYNKKSWSVSFLFPGFLLVSRPWCCSRLHRPPSGRCTVCSLNSCHLLGIPVRINTSFTDGEVLSIILYPRREVEIPCVSYSKIHPLLSLHIYF